MYIYTPSIILMLTHLHTSHAQIRTNNAQVFHNATNGEISVNAPGFSLHCVQDDQGKQHCVSQSAWRYPTQHTLVS